MTDADPHLMTVFAAALDRPSGSARAAYLDEACGTDAALRDRVEALLAAHAGAGRFLEPPPGDAPTAAAPPPGPEAGAVLGGRYKLLEVIGEGGMGSVWLAEQQEPVRRLIALKVIKAGMDSRGVLARFEAERQALALMDHPNIAKVLDGGATSEGRPFFVMELVKGVPITRYCDEHHLTPRERLELFVPVCQAVQHAHQKGVIHRDLKPSNVLVAPYDGRPVPKVIDFGVAKAAGQPLTDRTLYTGLGAVVGTPEYMSPEQAELNNRDIDTRSDVYALGVLLYELLTGSTPFSKRDLEKAGMLEMLRVIREQEPSKPSTKLSAAAGLPALAANRGTEPARLTRLVRGELDWIVMKALEKDRNRRYETANGFAMDVQRYLADEAVQACPPSAGYRLRKFTRRHRVAVAFTAVVSAAVVFALVGLAVATVLISGEKEKKAAAYEQARINEEAANEQRALADTQKELAEKNAAAAAEQRGVAQANERLAKASERLERRRFYASQTNLAMQAWRGRDMPRVLELLEGLRGASPEDDLRGFDWYYLWGLCQGGKRHFLRGHTRAVRDLDYSPDGKTLATASWDGTVRLWDVKTGQTRQILRGHTGGVWDVAYSPDGRYLASSCAEHESLIMWDAATGKPLHTIPVMSRGLVFTADSKRLLAGVLPEWNDVKPVPHQTRVWDVESGKQQLVLPESGVPMAVHPDGKTLVVLAGLFTNVCEIQFWDLSSRTKVRTTPADRGTHSVVLSRDGSRLTHPVWSVVHQQEYPSGKKIGNPLHLGTNIGGLAYSPDGRFLACGGQGRRVVVWDVKAEKQVFEDVHAGPVGGVAFSPDGKTLASACTETGLIKLWELGPTVEATTIANPLPVPDTRTWTASYLRFTPDGKTLLYGDAVVDHIQRPPAGELRTRSVDVDSGSVGPTRSRGSAHVSADATTAVSWVDNGELTVWDVRTDRVLARVAPGCNFPTDPKVAPGNAMPFLALSPDGKQLATACRYIEDASVKLWDVATGQHRILRTEPPQSNRQYAQALAFSPDGKRLAAGYARQFVVVWDLPTGTVKLQQSMPAGGAPQVTAVAFSPDGSVVAVGTDTGAIVLWEVDTGRKLIECRGHASTIQCLAFSPDGQVLASGAVDCVVRLWDVATGQERLALPAQPAATINVQFSPDGHTLAASIWNGEIKLWRASIHPEARALRRKSAPDDPFYEYAQRLAVDAVVLTIGPNPKERDPALALANAEKALARMPQLAHAHLAHGLAHYRLGHWARAIEVLGPLAIRNPDYYGLVGPMLAMAHWQLGHRDEARTWFNDSKSYWGRNADRRNAAYGLRVLAEAAKLLGEPPVGK